jgi:hypothetical protein
VPARHDACPQSFRFNRKQLLPPLRNSYEAAAIS